MSGRRILSIDVLRGLGIMVIIVIHRIHYTWTGMRNDEILHSQFSGPWAPILVFTIILFTMAGVFYFISGLVNAYALYGRASSGKCSVKEAVVGGVAGGLWIFLMNFVQRIFFMNGFVASEPDADPRFPVGIFTGFVRDPEQVSFSWMQITDPGTLSLIGLVVIFVSLVLGVLLHFRRQLSPNRMVLILVILAMISFILSPFSKFYLRPVYTVLFDAGRYLFAGCVGQVCQEFGLLPYVGYGFIGAIFGITFASGKRWKNLRRLSFIVAAIMIFTGSMSVIVFNREDPFGRGCIGSGICLVELGIFILVQLWLFKIYDNTDDIKYEKRKRQTRNIRRFGMLALTVYILEPLVAEIFRKAFDVLFGIGWNDHLQWVLLFGLFLLGFWWLTLRLWNRVGFIGSFEWLTGMAMQKLAGKKSGKVNFGRL